MANKIGLGKVVLWNETLKFGVIKMYPDWGGSTLFFEEEDLECRPRPNDRSFEGWNAWVDYTTYKEPFPRATKVSLMTDIVWVSAGHWVVAGRHTTTPQGYLLHVSMACDRGAHPEQPGTHLARYAKPKRIEGMDFLYECSLCGEPRRLQWFYADDLCPDQFGHFDTTTYREAVANGWLKIWLDEINGNSHGQNGQVYYKV